MVEENNVTTENQQITAVNTTQFGGMGFVGIKKVEYFSRTEDSIIFEDIMELLENRNYTNNLMLGFFSIKPFGTEKTEKLDSILSMNEDTNEMLIKQSLKKAALFDFAECQTSVVGEVYILIVADAIIHWDSTGSYIQPTQDNSLLLDLEDIIKAYPKSQKVTIYSQKDLSGFTVAEFEQKSVLDVPVKTNMWYNQPNFQQIYGNSVLIAGLVTLALTYGMMNWQKGKIEDLSSKVSILQGQSVNESYYSQSNKELADLKDGLIYKNIKSIILKDISNSLSKSGFKLDEISLNKTAEKNILLATVISKENSHTQFSVQEPLAQRIINNSQTIKAIRKKATSKPRLILEALVDLKEVKQATQKLKKKGS